LALELDTKIPKKFWIRHDLRTSSQLNSPKGMNAKVVFSREGIEKTSFLPVLVDKQLRPEVLRSGDPHYDNALNYVD